MAEKEKDVKDQKEAQIAEVKTVYFVKPSALRLDSGLITLGANNQTITLHPSGWNGIVAATQEDLKFLYAMRHPFVDKK